MRRFVWRRALSELRERGGDVASWRRNATRGLRYAGGSTSGTRKIERYAGGSTLEQPKSSDSPADRRVGGRQTSLFDA